MTERIFDEYSAREVFDWLLEEYADEYIKQNIEEVNGETIIFNVFDVEELKKNFIYHIRRYTVVRRGYTFYIHDEHTCKDIMMFKFTDKDIVDVENHVHNVCDDLNAGRVHFIGKKHRCDF